MRMLLPLVIKKADKILTVSEFSRKDLLRYYNISGNKVEVVYSYAQAKFAQRNLDVFMRQKLQGKYNLPEKFILFVGAIENRKNIKCILRVADRLKDIAPDIKVVLVGKRRHCDFDPVVEFDKRKEYVFYINGAQDKDLPFIYNMAFCFLFPTYYEGFGYPPLEAMQSGIPVVVSNNSSLPEVVGSAGILVEPDDLEAIISAVLKLNSDASFYNAIAEKGILQAKKFNGLDSTKKFVEIISSLSEI
jgi:glycosyltransferase involved in cell wall biosynthesis